MAPNGKEIPMLKKILFIMIPLMMTFASEFVTLEDGRVIMLKDNGRYEEVTLINKNGKQIALKKDGTWEEVSQEVPVVETIGKKVSQNRAASSELAKSLIGRWESKNGAFVYEFRPDGTMRIKRDNRWKSTTYKVDEVNEKKRNIVLNIGEGSRLGFLSIGGEHRTLHIEEDNKTMHDESYRVKHLRDLVLIKRR